MAKFEEIPEPGTVPRPRTFADVVAPPGVAPQDWQQPAPPSVFGVRAPPVPDSPDLERILALPRRPQLDLESPRARSITDMITARYSNGRAALDGCECRSIMPKRFEDGRVGCITRLLPVQAWMLYEIGIAGGLLGAVYVGGGKTLANLLSIFPLGVSKALLLVPPSLIRQIWRDYRMLSQHFIVPSIEIHTSGGQRARQLDRDGRQAPWLDVLPYSLLSRPESSAVVESLRPEAIISDECFPAETLVRTDVGDVPIGDVVDLGIGTRALAFDTKSGQAVWRTIIDRMSRPGTKPMVKVHHSIGSFTCTEDHKVWTTNRGYAHAVKLESTDMLRLCGDLEVSQVNRVEVLECGLECRVYDLTVDVDHNYFADGVLVSNCDRLRDIDGAGASRIMRYFAAHGDTKFCGWTGSLSDKGIGEFAHLAALALRYGSPLPLDLDAIASWGGALDALPCPGPPGALLKLCVPGESVRRGFHRRFVETLGIVSCDSSDVEIEDATGVVTGSVDVVIRERQAPTIPPEVRDALVSVRNFVRPDGEELVDALQVAKCAAEVACGFYYYWFFPRGEPRPLIMEWLAARKAWNQELRARLMRKQEHLDSPHLGELAAMRAWGDRPERKDRPNWKADNWPRWRDVKALVKPVTRAERISDYLALDACEWAAQNHGIVWYNMVEFGMRVAELSGLTMHTGGPKSAELIERERGERSIIVSLKSHGRGRDGLQYLYDTQLLANVPSSPTVWEQCLSSDTEVLTSKGWKGMKDDWADLCAAAYDLSDGSIVWSETRKVERLLGSESMYGISNPHLDIRVTAGHRMIVEPARHASQHLVTYDPARFVEAQDMPNVGRIPVAGFQGGLGVPLTDAELTFLGLFMSDGNLSKSNLKLFQSERYPEVIALIERTIDSCGFGVGHSVCTSGTPYVDMRSPLHCWTISEGRTALRKHPGKRGWGPLRAYIDKEFPPSLEHMTRAQLLVFLHGLWAGDGSKTPGTYAYDPYTPHTLNIASGRRVAADRIQALCVRRGMRCNVSTVKGTSMCMLRISIDDHSWTIKRKSSDTRPVWAVVPSDPNEKVWCVEVSTGAIVTRRNGKVAVVGNCLGRLHRRGQTSGVVTSDVYLHTPEFKKALAQAMRRGNYVEETLGERQKLLTGWQGDDVLDPDDESE